MFPPRRSRKILITPPRRKPSRRAKKGVTCKDIFALFSTAAHVPHDSSATIYQADTAFLSTLDLEGPKFTPTPTICVLNKDVYLSRDHTYAYI